MKKKGKNNFKRFFIIMFMMVFIAALFTGCNENDPEPDPPKPVITAAPSASPSSITLPTPPEDSEPSITLTCIAESADGSAASYAWSVHSKPAGSNPSIANANTGTATVIGLNVAGNYQFRCTVTGSNGITDTRDVTVKAGLNTTVNFVSLGTFPGTILNFSPNGTLPAGVTYTVKDNRPISTTWNTATGWNGQLNASIYDLELTNVTFTQTFYLNGVKLTGAGSERTVVMRVDNYPSSRFNLMVSDTGPVTLTW